MADETTGIGWLDTAFEILDALDALDAPSAKRANATGIVMFSPYSNVCQVIIKFRLALSYGLLHGLALACDVVGSQHLMGY